MFYSLNDSFDLDCCLHRFAKQVCRSIARQTRYTQSLSNFLNIFFYLSRLFRKDCFGRVVYIMMVVVDLSHMIECNAVQGIMLRICPCSIEILVKS